MTCDVESHARGELGVLALEVVVHVGRRVREDALGEVAHHLLAALEHPLVEAVLVPALVHLVRRVALRLRVRREEVTEVGELRRLHAGGGRERDGAERKHAAATDHCCQTMEEK